MCAAQTNIQKKTKKQAKDPKHSKMTVLSAAVALVKHDLALCSSARTTLNLELHHLYCSTGAK